MKTKSILIKIFFGLLFFHHAFIFSQDKTASCYIIQQLVPNTNEPGAYYNNRFKIRTIGEYYVANKQDILHFIEKDSVDFCNLTMIIDIRTNPSLDMFISAWDSIQGGVLISDIHTKIMEILTLQGSEIYAIGGKYYVLRKIKYAYLDTLKVYGKWNDLASYIYGDYIPIPLAEMLEKNKTPLSVNEILHVDNYQVFYSLTKLLPTDKKILKHLWKRKYELD